MSEYLGQIQNVHFTERPNIFWTFIREIPLFNVNCSDPDQMPHSMVSDLGLHCLPLAKLWL